MQPLFDLKNSCTISGKESSAISSTLGVCLSFIRNKSEKALVKTKKVHKIIRKKYYLPYKPPKDKNGIQCSICTNKCKIDNGKKGFCGLREN